MTAWAHLPNARVIDTIVASCRVSPERWQEAFGLAWSIETSAVLDTAWAMARDMSLLRCGPRADLGASWAMAAHTKLGRLAESARGCVYALIAWDSSADLLSLTPDALRAIIYTCDGDVKHQAVLLLPAVIARSTP